MKNGGVPPGATRRGHPQGLRRIATSRCRTRSRPPANPTDRGSDRCSVGFGLGALDPLVAVALTSGLSAVLVLDGVLSIAAAARAAVAGAAGPLGVSSGSRILRRIAPHSRQTLGSPGP